MSEEPVNCSRTKRKKNLRGRGRNKAKPVSGRISVRAKARVRQFCLGNESGSGSGSGSGSSHRNRLGCLPDNCEMQTTTSEWPKKRKPMRSLINLWLPLSLQTHCEVSYWISGPGPLFLGLDCRTAVLAFESRPRKERTGLKEGASRLERCCRCHQGNSRKSHEPR